MIEELIITEEYILSELGITDEILNIYPYGSRAYGTADADSDYDFIIVTKSSMLKSGAFRQNAISNKDRTIQGVLYSRGGFIDAINNYEIGVLECLFLPEELIIKKKWDFAIQKWNEKEFIKKIITKVSASWYVAANQARSDWQFDAKKGIYHSLRILEFALQLKEHGKIVDFKAGNQWKELFKTIPDEDFDDRNYLAIRDELINRLKA